MQSVEETAVHDDVVKKTCIITNIAYLLTHIAYLVFFLITKTYPLVYVNIGSSLIYTLFFLLIKYNKYRLYAEGCGIEIIGYMITATILCGFNPGFHLCIIGLCIIAFYTSYFSKTKRDNRGAVIWTIASMFLYLFLYLYCSFKDPKYPLKKWANVLLFCTHATVVFVFICAYLKTFTNYAIKLEDRIKKESRTDRLTQIPNRLALYEYLNSLDNKKEYCLAIFDIDDFKKINDKYGHICGDYVLKEVASVALNNIANSFISRYGGEEFIIIFKRDENDIYEKIDNVRRSICDNIFRFDNYEIRVTITVGASNYDDNIENDEWINIADSKLYEGKRTGKNKTVI